ncbi:MAG: hypothetical protein ACM31L_13570 [Actinomycetota bacterium]
MFAGARGLAGPPFHPATRAAASLFTAGIAGGGWAMLKAVGWIVGIIFLIGLLVVLGLLKWIF